MEADGGRIVVGVDGTPEARAAVAFALQEAARRGAVVAAVIAFDIPVDWGAVHGALPDPDWPTADEAHEAAEAEAAHIVDVVRADMSGDLPAPPPVAISAVPGAPADVL